MSDEQPRADSGKDRKTREREAAESGGRAAGYCYVEHPEGGACCTRPPGHYPRTKHTSYYFRRGEEFD